MINTIELPWAEFKTQVLDSGNYQWLFFQINNHYHIYAKQASFTVLCKIYKDGGADQLDFEENYQASANLPLKMNVTTESEKNDKVLKLASMEGTFDENGECTINFLVPEEFNGIVPPANGRWAAGGYAFTDAYKFGDRITEVNVIDIDRVMAIANGGLTDEQMQAVVPTYPLLKTYHDTHVVEAYQGWRMYASQGGQGEIEIDPIGGYGFIPSGLYIQLKFKKAEGSPATKVAADLWWARTE